MNPLRKLYKKNSTFRRVLAQISDKIEYAEYIYWLGAAIIVSIIALLLYFNLPEELKTPLTTIVSAVLSAFIIPVIINNKKIKNDNNLKQYERNLKFYIDLAAKVIDVIKTKEQTEQRKNIALLINFISDNYSNACLTLSKRQNEILFDIKDECLMFFDPEEISKASVDNIRSNAEIFFSKARNQGGVPGSFSFSERLMETQEAPIIGNMNP